MEEWGSGYRRIMTSCTENGYDIPEWFEVGPTIRVVFSPHSLTIRTETHIGNNGVPVNEGVNEGVRTLYSLIQKNIGKRAPFFAKKAETSVKNIERWLKQLKDEEKIEFRGAPKTGGYYVKTANKDYNEEPK